MCFVSERPPRVACGILPVMADESAAHALVDLTRQLVEAFDRGDLDAIERLGADDAVLHATALGVRFEGVRAIRAFIEDWFGSFADLAFELREVHRCAAGVVLVLIDQSGRPVGTLGSIQQVEAWVIEWGAGQITQLASYLDIAEARAAAERLALERADG
jgi:ketosteroid isomerase-like protein